MKALSIIDNYDSSIGIMRIIAAFAVVFLHCSSLTFTGGIFCDAISRFCVPLFVIISGYHMLSKKYEAIYIFKKCCRLLILMLLFSLLYYLYFTLSGTMEFKNISDLIYYLFTEPIHLWYLYAAIILYILTPILYVFCQHAEKKESLYALCICFVFGSLITILLRSECFSIVSVIIDKMKIPYLLGFVFLYLLGGYFYRYPLQSMRTRSLFYILGGIGVIATFIGTYFLATFNTNISNDLLLSFFAPNVMLYAIAIFVFFQHQNQIRPITAVRAKKAIYTLASCTLGIYLLHPMIIHLSRRIFADSVLVQANIIAIVLNSILSYGIALVVVYLVKILLRICKSITHR